ncbi:hypothetical protein DCAR_0623913 [Daucus carota subsp. sativus]|uniref:MSP domain-containing protein n=1 Tax=Daucus carota subsp. sativus TaxID=79200 RepID=A0AAF1B2T2_DAUCS|nr:hypothetical protein DCAR_0623913 [Daucus carota subsp. sativus]
MSTELLEIQPQEIRFIIESKKQCSCSVRLVNKTNQHVAFKVITTSPRKYRVRPNTGVLNPKGICDFTVTMQAQLDIPLDLICKDKFLLQCAMVVAGTTEEDITSVTYVEGKKLGVILVSPPNSITLSPVNERLNQVQSYEVSIPEDQNPNSIENLISHQTVTEDAKENKKDVAEDLKPIIKENTEESMQSKDVVHEMKDELISKTKKDLEEILKDIKDSKPLSVVASKLMDGDELKLVKEIEEVKSKIIGSESKLNEAERKISKLTEEKRLSTQDRKIVQELVTLLTLLGISILVLVSVLH